MGNTMVGANGVSRARDPQRMLPLFLWYCHAYCGILRHTAAYCGILRHTTKCVHVQITHYISNGIFASICKQWQ